MCVLGHLQQFFTDGLVQSARSRSILGVRSSNLAQIEAENKGFHLNRQFFSKFSLLGGLFLGRKYDEVPKLRPVADGPYITATTYCPTRFFCLRLDHSGP